MKLTRSDANPVISPSNDAWEKTATMNGCVTKVDDTFHMVYRAVSEEQQHHDNKLHLSTIGHAQSPDGIHFTQKQQFIKPEHDWEIFGCEDPRITKFEDTYYIFYTALSTYPFSAPGIRSAVALTKDFKTIDKKTLITPFNSKAMTLFPERIGGKMAVILTANTDMPPSKISIAYFDRDEELFSQSYWENWYAVLDDHALPLQRNNHDHVEIGAPPVKTKDGWLLIYSYIQGYFTDNKVFTIEAMLLDHDDPRKILGRTAGPLLVPETDYEKYGFVPDIVFPTGALINGDELFVYYGGADTVTCLATCKMDDLMKEIKPTTHTYAVQSPKADIQLERFSEDPILRPNPDHAWESKYVFNPAAVYEDGKVYIVYRAMGEKNISVMGLAISKDGFHIDERLPDPIYVPRESFETNDGDSYSGCEDPRIVKLEDRYYMTYTAYDGASPPRVALTSISVKDFLDRKWDKWDMPKLISPPDIDDKDACVFPEKVDGQYMFLHRFPPSIWVDFADDLEFKDGKFLQGQVLLEPRPDKWDKDKIGIAGPPVATDEGWLLLYHGIENGVYKTGAVLLSKKNPLHILAETDDPILEPILKWEKEGWINNVVFPCGNVVIGDTLYVYYGGADTVVGVATIKLKKLLSGLREKK